MEGEVWANSLLDSAYTLCQGSFWARPHDLTFKETGKLTKLDFSTKNHNHTLAELCIDFTNNT